MKMYIRSSHVPKPEPFMFSEQELLDFLSQIDELQGLAIEASTNVNGGMQIIIGDKMYEII